MAAVARKTNQLKLSRDVKEFASERALEPYLPAIMQLFQRIFHGARKLSVDVDCDPEIPNLRHLLFTAIVPWRTYEQADAARTQWYRGTERICPKHLVTDLRLSIDRRP